MEVERWSSLARKQARKHAERIIGATSISRTTSKQILHGSDLLLDVGDHAADHVDVAVARILRWGAACRAELD